MEFQGHIVRPVFLDVATYSNGAAKVRRGKFELPLRRSRIRLLVYLSNIAGGSNQSDDDVITLDLFQGRKLIRLTATGGDHSSGADQGDSAGTHGLGHSP